MTLIEPVIGFERYGVSNDGKVWSKCRSAEWQEIKPNQTQCGYLIVRMKKDGKQFASSIHRLVVSAFLGPIPDHMQVNHINGIKTDNRIENLEICSPSRNIQHAFSIGLKVPPCVKGEFKKSSKLTPNDVRAIRSLHALGGHTQRDIARIYGVCHSTIASIFSERTWAHVH